MRKTVVRRLKKALLIHDAVAVLESPDPWKEEHRRLGTFRDRLQRLKKEYTSGNRR